MSRRKLSITFIYEVEENQMEAAIDELETFAVDMLNMPPFDRAIEETMNYQIKVDEEID